MWGSAIVFKKWQPSSVVLLANIFPQFLKYVSFIFPTARKRFSIFQINVTNTSKKDRSAISFGANETGTGE